MILRSKLSIFLLAISFCVASLPALALSQVTKPTKLILGEGFVNPIGYYEGHPRFSWQLDENSKSDFQSAYQIQVSSSPVDFGKQSIWDTGKIISSDNAWIKYDGNTLISRQRAYWRVRIWNESDQASSWSDVQSLELGLLNNKDWQAKWIGHPDTSLDKKPTQETLAKAQYLRKAFTVDGKVKHARLHISAKGLFKPYLNGQEIAPQESMTPGWTPYHKRIESLSYNLDDKIQQGENVLSSSIAGGWYSSRVYKFTEREHLLPARLLAQLEITFEDGTKQWIVSDETWQSSINGPIQFSSIYDGERYSQALEMPNWTSTSFTSAEHWTPAIAKALEHDILIEPKRHAPITHTQTLDASAIISDAEDHESGIVIFDFGQNMVGVPAINLPVIKGQEVKIRFAEALNKGEFYTDNYRSAKSTIYFTPASSGMAQYQPTFTYFGYRYIEISGFDANQLPSKKWASALVQHSDLLLHKPFTSDNKKLNQLTENVVWGLRSNFFDIPLDCPQRDERLGWTGDAQVFAPTSMYLSDAYAFWSAWLQSVREEQKADGMIPLYVPFVKWINWGSSGWGDAATIIPWDLYMMTGDKQILADNYPMMQSWLDFHESKSKNHISSMETFGDWLQPYQDESKGDGRRGDTDPSLISTAFYLRSIENTMKAAKVLGKIKDAESLLALHQEKNAAFLQHFFDDKLNLKASQETQTTYLLGLEFGLFPEHKVSLAQQKLVKLISKADNHLRTGFLGTPLLMPALQKAGRSDLAYELLLKESYPSWFYSINNGATTTWERWNSYSIENGFNSDGMNSLNHYAYGSVAQWFYEGILGITPVEAGFTRIKIAPQMSHAIGSAQGSYATPQGVVEVHWRIQDDQYFIDLSVPKNTHADLVLPAGSGTPNESQLLNLPPGKYSFNGKVVGK